MYWLSSGCHSSAITVLCHLYWILLLADSTWSFSAQIQISQKLNHLVIDPDSGNLYVGAVNHLFRFSDDLGLDNEVVTGPKKDNAGCYYPFGGERCKSVDNNYYETEDTNNVNKILILDKANSQLLTCGSVYQGSCETFNLDLTHNSTYRDDEDYFVAANDEDSTTLAFLSNKTLYVGATYSGSEVNAETRVKVPLVSSRKISGRNILKYTATDDLEATGTYLSLSDVIQQTYLISYISGFGFKGYSYFFTTQRESLKSQKYTSKIAQICQNDKQFTSYVEMPLICKADNIHYNLITSAVLTRLGKDLASNSNIPSTDYVIVATFVKSQMPDGDDRSNESAVCIFTMDSVRKKFTENLQNCFNGFQKETGEQFRPTAKCVNRANFNVSINYCGELAINSPLAGEVPLMSSPLITFSGESPLTAIAIDIVQSQYTVAFIGTEEGHLKKVLLSSNGHSKQYSNLTIDQGSPVNKDLLFSRDRKYLYVMTTHKITKVPVQECDSKTSCVSCLSPGDPYCGWCSLENKCSPKISCKQNTGINRWLTKKDWCIAITNYSPKLANIHLPKMVTLSVTSLPRDQNYKCVYRTSNAEVVLEAHFDGSSQVQCSTPADQSGLWIEQGQDNLNTTLALRSVETNVDFLHTNFTLYTCSEYVMCSQCTLSKFPCHWCLYDNQCRDAAASCTQNEGSIGQKDECPSLQPKAYLLPSGVAQDVQIQAKNLPADQHYVCQLYKDNKKVTEVRAFYSDSSEIVCNQLQYSIQGSDHYQIFGLKIMWKNDFEVEGSLKNVTVYSCNNMATDCTVCTVSPNIDYNCVWCQNGGCSYRESCQNPILRANMCPNAKITSTEPTTFPLDGGTNITITGSNIGQVQSDILNVTVGDEPCSITKYETSKQILCRTNRVKSVKQGRLCIYIKNNPKVCTQSNLQYKDPRLTSINPVKGPISGHTEITITGQSLDTGKDITVLLGNVSCNITRRTDDKLVCIKTNTYAAEKMPHPTKEIKVIFDIAERTLDGYSFTFYPDPDITAIKPLKTFKSGGRKVNITGTYLDTSIKPTITLIRDGKTSVAEVCSPIPDGLSCTYPPDPDLTTKRAKREAVTYSLSLDIDGVPCAQNISACFQDVADEVTMYPDPIYYPFNGTKFLKGESLVLKGKNLNLACTENEVTVWIGKKKCNVDSLNVEKLVCTTPEEWHKQSNSPVNVKVITGNLNFSLGKLAYKDPVDQLIWITGSAVGGGTLIFIIIIILIVYKRRSADVERQNKKLQIQLDTLESNVRSECKQAFAELQTEVSDFTSDLNVIGIPFWDYKMYTFRVLFPGFKTHAVLQDRNKSSTSKFGGYDQGLHQFNQLLNSKQFLLIFIRTLEQQKNFSIRDKSTVASLLMIVLQDKMEYATEILKALLDELIDRSVEKKHPKLMLRRTESVVEKLLSNWLSLSMYTYLKKHAGKMLFMLYKAIKHQTEKGPVDVFTAEAKYSLSEDRLLREKVEPKTLTLHVLMNDMKEPVTFKALNCDTITQAKEKAIDAIYMNAPFSSRPSVHNLDLEWHSGRSGQLILQDEDVTTNLSQGWKRVNTLSHYHVPDGAMLVLTPAHNENDMIRQVHGMIEITNSQSSLPPIVTVEEGTKVWHLVKHDDSQNMPRTQKVISEIFLTRLLTTKGTLQQYIDDLFMTVLRADSALPPAIKYLFDFLDHAARRHNIVDPDVVHTWKSNSLPLRFWVNIIKNPEFIFDIHKSNIVDSCLSVIAQTFMDSCSTVEHRLGKDSPSNKLLFAKDIPRYRGWVGKFYKSVQDMTPISDQEMTRVMTEMSMTNLTDFNVAVALQELYKYATQYNFELLEALDDDPSAKRLHLANRFEQVQAVIAGTPSY